MATNKKEYMRNYMARYITVNGQYISPDKKKKVCIDCNHREPEKGCRFCSECRESRDYINGVIKSHKQSQTEKRKIYLENYYKNKSEKKNADNNK
jgi:hypothetical protein